MTTEEARMLWLLTFGSGWVSSYDLFNANDEVILAYKELLKTEFDLDPLNDTIKIKCKS
jgi:hypothetical protein